MAYEGPHPFPITSGGTKVSSFTGYAPICGGTTSTGALQQSTTGLSSSGYVLSSNGNAAVPSFVNPGFFLIETVNVSGGQVVLTLNNSIYAGYYIFVNSLFPTNNGDTIFMKVSTDGGATYLNSGYISGITGFAYNSTTPVNYNSTTNFVLAGAQHNEGSNGLTGVIYYCPSAGSNGTVLSGTITSYDTNTGGPTSFLVMGDIPLGTNPTNLLITCASGLVNAFSVMLYGMRPV